MFFSAFSQACVQLGRSDFRRMLAVFIARRYSRFMKTHIRTLFFIFMIAAGFSPADAQELTVGWIGALTGDAAGIGTEIAGSLEAAVTEMNQQGGIGGRRLRVLAEDDGYEITQALNAYEKLKSRVNTRVIFMSTYGALFALGQRPQQDRIVIIDTLDCNDSLAAVSQYHFCAATRTESIAGNFITAIAANGGGKVAVLYEEEAWFNFIVRGLRTAYGRDLVEVTAPVRVGDYRAELMRIKASGAKHLILLGNDAMGRAVKQLADLKIEVPLYSIAGIMSPGFQRLAGPALEGTFVSHWEAGRTAAFDRFRALFSAVNKRTPVLEFVAVPTYDAARVLFGALGRVAPAGDPVDGSALRQALLAAPAYDGISGTIRFEADGAVRTILEKPYVFRAGALQPWQGSDRR